MNKILKRKQQGREINGLKTQTGQISHPTELAECFNNHFTNIGLDIAKNIDIGDRNFKDYITTTTSSFYSIFKKCLNQTYTDFCYLEILVILLELTKSLLKSFALLLR